MTTTWNHVRCTWEVVQAQLERTSMSWQGNPLSDRDKHTFTEAIVMCAIHLMDLKQSVGPNQERELIAWAHLCASLDAAVLGGFLSDATLLLRNSHEVRDYKAFKRALSEKYPFVGSFLAPMRLEFSNFLEDPSPQGYAMCAQFLAFMSHVSFVDIPSSMEDEYLELELSLHNRRLPSDILYGMNTIMREWMATFEIDEGNFFPRHGNGATFEVARTDGNLAKYSHLWVDEAMDAAFTLHAGIDLGTYIPVKEWSIPEYRNRVVEVPKSIKTKRTISCEPTALQYFQQGVRECLYDYVNGHPYLSRHIDFCDQTPNGELAILGSRDGSYSTIDLSSASDTITVDMVMAVFDHTPVLPYLASLRSRIAVLPSGKEVEMLKYAPMGSALCFPVMTLLLACVVEYAARRAQRTFLGNYKEYRVFGDDIIVQTPLFHDVLLVLGALGFRANETKCFTSPSRFRESCGVDAYDGVDVTPMRISRGYSSLRFGCTSKSVTAYESHISLANHAGDRDFRLLRAWVVRSILQSSRLVPLFSGDPSVGIFSPNPDNFRARTRFSGHCDRRPWTGMWRSECLVACVTTSENAPVMAFVPVQENARLFETLRCTRNRTGDMFDPAHRVQVGGYPTRTRLQERWVPKPA